MKKIFLIFLLHMPIFGRTTTSDLYYDHIRKYCILDYHFVSALIYAESGWKEKAIGPIVKIFVYRKNKKVIETHRAYGLMQVLSIYSDPKKLLIPEHNIKIGCRILNYCFIKNNKNLIETLRCYNSGQNSSYYNKKYIQKVLKLYGQNFQKLL